MAEENNPDQVQTTLETLSTNLSDEDNSDQLQTALEPSSRNPSSTQDSVSNDENNSDKVEASLESSPTLPISQDEATGNKTDLSNIFKPAKVVLVDAMASGHIQLNPASMEMSSETATPDLKLDIATSEAGITDSTQPAAASISGSHDRVNPSAGQSDTVSKFQIVRVVSLKDKAEVAAVSDSQSAASGTTKAPPVIRKLAPRPVVGMAGSSATKEISICADELTKSSKSPVPGLSPAAWAKLSAKISTLSVTTKPVRVVITPKTGSDDENPVALMVYPPKTMLPSKESSSKVMATPKYKAAASASKSPVKETHQKVVHNGVTLLVQPDPKAKPRNKRKAVEPIEELSSPPPPKQFYSIASSSRKCSVLDCKNNSRNRPKNVRFYRFPVRDRDRCEVWLSLCNSEDLFDLPEAMLYQRVICSEHFRDKDFMSSDRMRLVPTAVPTVFRDRFKSYRRPANQRQRADGSDDDDPLQPTVTGVFDSRTGKIELLRKPPDEWAKESGQRMEALEHFTKYSNDPAAAMSWLHSKNIGREEDPDMPVALDVSDHRYASSQTLDGAKGSYSQSSKAAVSKIIQKATEAKTSQLTEDPTGQLAMTPLMSYIGDLGYEFKFDVNDMTTMALKLQKVCNKRLEWRRKSSTLQTQVRRARAQIDRLRKKKEDMRNSKADQVDCLRGLSAHLSGPAFDLVKTKVRNMKFWEKDTWKFLKELYSISPMAYIKLREILLLPNTSTVQRYLVKDALAAAEAGDGADSNFDIIRMEDLESRQPKTSKPGKSAATFTPVPKVTQLPRPMDSSRVASFLSAAFN